jgi:hypothetical protein
MLRIGRDDFVVESESLDGSAVSLDVADVLLDTVLPDAQRLTLSRATQAHHWYILHAAPLPTFRRPLPCCRQIDDIAYRRN